MRDNKVIGIIAGVVSLGSGLALALSLSGSFGPPSHQAPFEAVGRALARQTLAFLKPGGRVTVITRDTQTFENPATDFQFAGFQQELAKAGVKIDSIQALQVDPLQPMSVPAGDFFQSIKSSGKGDVLVSFMGPPILTDTQVAQLGEIKPAIIAFCSGLVRDQVDLRALFSHGLLRAAVVSKRTADIKPASSPAEHDSFDRQFLQVTAANVAGVGAASVASP
jgi:hypothetical protein